MNAWLEELAEVEQERRGYLRLAAKGRMTDAELDRALGEPHPELTKRVRSYGAHRLVNMWVPTVNLLQG
jgi:hypothetical protein